MTQVELTPQFAILDIIPAAARLNLGDRRAWEFDFPLETGVQAYGIGYEEFRGKDKEPLAALTVRHSEESYFAGLTKYLHPNLARLSIVMTRNRNNEITQLQKAQVWLDSETETTEQQSIFYVAEYSTQRSPQARLGLISNFTRHIQTRVQHDPDYTFNSRFSPMAYRLKYAQAILGRTIPLHIDWYGLVHLYAKATRDGSVTPTQMHQNPFNPLQSPAPVSR